MRNSKIQFSLILLRWIYDYSGQLIKKPKLNLLAMLKILNPGEFACFSFQDENWEIASAICFEIFGQEALQQFRSCRQSDLAGFGLSELAKANSYYRPQGNCAFDLPFQILKAAKSCKGNS